MSSLHKLKDLYRPKTGRELDERYGEMEKLGLERRDMAAMIIGGFMAFAPILIAVAVCAGALLLVFR